MKKILSMILALCLALPALSLTLAEAPDDELIVVESTDDGSSPIEGDEAIDLDVWNEADDTAEAEPPVDEAPEAETGYARLIRDGAICASPEDTVPWATLPEGSVVLVIRAEDGVLEVAFAADGQAVTGYIPADCAAPLSGNEVAALMNELAASGSVLLYEGDLDRPLPAAEAKSTPAESADPHDGQAAEAQADEGSEVPTAETAAEEAVSEDSPEELPEDAEASVEAEGADELAVEAEESPEGGEPADGETEGEPILAEAEDPDLSALSEPRDPEGQPVYDDEYLMSIESVEEMIHCFIDTSRTDDDLFAGYASRILYKGSARARATMATSYAGEQLTGQDRAIYEALKAEILKVAAGERASTTFKVPVADVLGKETFTTAEYSALLQSGIYTWVDDIDLITQALWFDCTYELYWFDRYSYNSGVTARWASSPFKGSKDSATGTYTYSVAGQYITFNFPVLDEYAGVSDFLVDTSRIAGAKKAAENAKAIVNKYAGSTDYAKLYGYAKEICDLVSYNDSAAQTDWDMMNQDPWKLIWVFDGDSSTNVVCEGYAQAFQYLCELTSFSGGVRCIMVVGNAGSEKHSWNIVRMDDGKNYMVDVTWMDSSKAMSGLSGSMADWISDEKGGLFLVGARSGSVSGGYTVNYRTGSSTTTRTYWSDTLNAYPTSALALADSKYVLTGFQRIEGHTYFFDENGHYLTGTHQLDGVYFDFDSNGRLQGAASGWRTIGGRQYFFESDGELHTQHTPVTDEAVAPSCTDTGLTEGSHCSVCGAVLTAQEVVPAKGHTPVTDPAVASTYTKTGLTEGSHCSVCGAVLVAQEVAPVLDPTFHMKKNATKKVNVGDLIQIVVDGQTVKSYKSSDKKVATVTKKGRVTAKGAGTAKITITLKNKKKLTLTVKVTDPYAPKSIKIVQGKKATINLKVKQKLTLETTLTPDYAKSTLTWTSSNKKVATVSKKGVVTAKKAGKAKITVTTANGKKAAITITVKK